MDIDKENQVKLVYGEDHKAQLLKSAVKKIVKNEVEDDASAIKCPLCKKMFTNSEALSKHIKTHRQTSKTGEANLCYKCDKKFIAFRDLKKHIDIVHFNKADEYKKECPICFTKVQQLKTHIRFIHRNEAKKSEFNCKCPHCDKTFSNDYKVNRHIKTVHEGIKNWQCTICPKSFYEKKDLTRHVKGVHMGQKVDTWRTKKNPDGHVSKRKSTNHVVISKNFLSTVDVSNAADQITLPVNVLDEEGEDDPAPVEDKVQTVNEKDRESTTETNVTTETKDKTDDEIEISEVDPVEEEDEDCRFQISQATVDEDGNIVLELEEKKSSPLKSSPGKTKKQSPNKMVTVKWGEKSKDVKEEEASNVKIIDMNLNKEADIHDNDFILPEVVGDLPDWFLNTSNELDFSKETATAVEDSKSDQQPQQYRHQIQFQSNSIQQDQKTAFRCGACGKMFVTLDFLKSHIEKAHVSQKLETSSETEATNDVVQEEEIVMCNIDGCSKSFSGRTKKLQLKRHVDRVHNLIKNHQCPKCDFKFFEQRDLTRHIDSIHLGKKTMCPYKGCNKPFSRLDQHMRQFHSSNDPKKANVKASKCPECGAMFNRVYDMTRHRENVHRGNKNFVCVICERRFSDKRDLRRHHDAVHLKIKQSKIHKCPYCDAKMKSAKLLDAHLLQDHSNQQAETPVIDLSVKQALVNINKTGKDEGSEMTDEIQTVEIDGQLFIVHQNDDGISLLPVIKTQSDTLTMATATSEEINPMED